MYSWCLSFTETACVRLLIFQNFKYKYERTVNIRQYKLIVYMCSYKFWFIVLKNGFDYLIKL